MLKAKNKNTYGGSGGSKVTVVDGKAPILKADSLTFRRQLFLALG